MDRKQFLQTTAALAVGGLLDDSIISKVSAAEISVSEVGANTQLDFPIMDLHVHRSDKQSIEDIVEKSKRTGIKFGVMENVAPLGITNDEQLKAYLDAVSPYPVYVGLQPMSPGWSKNLSKELIERADYVAMDPQIVTNGNGYGEDVMVWEYATYIEDAEAFMERNMAHYINILTGDEPLDIFACPLLLPYCIEREYSKLWTKKRLQTIIDAAKARDIAIEISDMMRVPHDEFILMAKRAGLKFTFGSDTRDEKTGRLDYCKYIAKRCGLKENDFFVPKLRI